MLRSALLIVVALALVACQPQKFNGVDITGSSIGSDFSLADHTGAKRNLAEFRGKVVVLFFGFMNCPDVCPSTLSEMAAVKKKLGRDGVIRIRTPGRLASSRRRRFSEVSSAGGHLTVS